MNRAPSAASSRPAPAAALREIRRGECGDEIELVTTDGAVVLLHAHGLHPDEQFRVRESALQLLQSGTARHG